MEAKGWGPPQCLFSNVNKVYTSQEPVESVSVEGAYHGKVDKEKKASFFRTTMLTLDWSDLLRVRIEFSISP